MKAKLSLAIDRDIGMSGIQEVLKAYNIGFKLAEASGESMGSKLLSDKTYFRSLENIIGDTSDELIYWPGIGEDDPRRIMAKERGQTQTSVSEFLHSLWKDDIVFLISEPFVWVKERPLLWQILREAGFEPSLLWKSREGKWFSEKGRGQYWIIPESWAAKMAGESAIGRPLLWTDKPASWVVRNNALDFYCLSDRLSYLGSLPRWQEPLQEQAACATIAQAINLGVSWSVIERVLERKGLKDRINLLRWNSDDIQRIKGPSGEELSPEVSEHMENWRAG